MVQHPRQDTAVGFGVQAIHHLADRRPERGAGFIGGRLLRRITLEVRQTQHQPLVPAEDVLPGHVLQAEHETEALHAHRVGVGTEQVGLTVGGEPLDQVLRQPGDHAASAFFDVPRTEGCLGDGTEPRLLRTLHAQHVLAHRAIQGRRRGGGGEHLGREVDMAHVLVPGDEPQSDRGHPADGFVLAERSVDRIGVTLERLERDGLPDRHRLLPRRPLRIAPRSATGYFVPERFARANRCHSGYGSARSAPRPMHDPNRRGGNGWT